MKIGGHDLARRVLVVAEIGNNHEGSADVAAELIDRAAECGVDAVKFQTFRTPYFVSRVADENRFKRLQKFELRPADFARLAERARSRGLLFLSTPLDLDSVGVLEPLVDAFKIASSDNTFYPLLEAVAATSKPVVVSTGMATLDELRTTRDFIMARRHAAADSSVAFLHCVTAYPVEPSQVNLRAIATLAAGLNCAVGYSDHALGIEAAVSAVAAGARIVEKHFTLSTTYSEFRDHALSADPGSMRELVTRVRAIETMLGTGIKEPQPSEATVITALRRSIVAAGDFPEGHTLCAADLTWVRPGGGLPPGDEHRLIGRRLLRPVRFGDMLRPSDVRDVNA